MLDHQGRPATHGRIAVNGTRLHYVVAGSGEPLLLLHGVPKSLHYWHLVLPLLTPHYTVIAPDIRGFGDSARPDSGYDMRTVSDDVAELVTGLGYSSVKVHGEDWGAAFGYALAAYHPELVEKLSYADMLLPGYGLTEGAYYTPENVKSGHWVWHLNLFALRDYPEMLIPGHDREFWTAFMRDECVNPDAITDEDIDIFLRGCTAPGGLRAILSVYRAAFENSEQTLKNPKLKQKTLGIGASYWLGDEVKRIVSSIAEDWTYVSMDCGHSLALEKPHELTEILLGFFQGD
ncbi:alpha/beta fold hydrolase [Amycolatopsis viridis]|uniref:Pimeloyl-ACP methyl ester carboxylesterase n=1 Tax=Amycolatopsis viridis TaxID=185678 RepID=A0ABX0SQS4_9PSEU|nr:alpha/beta hydrolase [Amycolatopsis viridis]NIH78883.1 pimeloyl-ACP methyl ester carboxylesterase [Amycolatopsis viridis]